jgi:hypothetical protein
MVLQVPIIPAASPQPVAQVKPHVLPLFQQEVPYLRPAYGAMTGPNLIGSDNNKSIANIFCFRAFADKKQWIIYHDLTGSFPFMPSDESVSFFKLYRHKSNSILATPIAGLDNIRIFNTYKK